MKSDFEMVESILNKAREKEKHMKKIKKTAALGLAAVVAVCAAVGAGWMRSNTPSVPVTDTSVTNECVQTNDNTQPAAAAGFRLLWASAAQTEAEKDTLTPVDPVSGVRLPVYGRLVIEDAAGLSDEEKGLARERIAARIAEGWPDKDARQFTGAESENYVGVLGVRGRFVAFAEEDALESIELSCGAYGNLILMPAMQGGKTPILGKEWYAALRSGQNLTVSGEDYANVYLNSSVDEASGERQPIGMFVTYQISDAFLNEKEQRPELGCADYSDEITFCALFKDGSEASYTLLLTFDDAGILTVTVK